MHRSAAYYLSVQISSSSSSDTSAGQRFPPHNMFLKIDTET